MSELVTRTFRSDLEVRSLDDRVVRGIAAPFDDPAEVHDHHGSYVETIRRGAFARTIAERGHRVKLLKDHDPTQLRGRAILLREDALGLYGEFRVSRTPAGDEFLELVNDGSLDGLSISGYWLNAPFADDYRSRDVHEVKLIEVSGTPFPVYEGSTLHRSITVEQALAQLDAITNPCNPSALGAGRSVDLAIRELELLETIH